MYFSYSALTVDNGSPVSDSSFFAASMNDLYMTMIFTVCLKS
ncbi:hypothetical protein HOLDEFILI_00799 [Holdemania filiformis DSM 12042]|uniref:Uncharacterized protein n=1 Tax=Holdemania filiformis DSM 12042 TaxID=545696 RepID=B9Y4R8_9FIRM|nr:hypothetical protein HOLDEFILI_00799 [Holdemania filiformis DSM 12042]